jgi:chemotaxis protein CheC
MMAMALEPDQEDALREIANVAMGRAADHLARLFDVFVRLPVPRVCLLSSGEILAGVLRMTNSLSRVTCVRQAFGSRMHGEALALFDPRGLDDLARLVEPDAVTMNDAHLLELSNLLVGACMGATGRALGHELTFSPPSILVHDGPLTAIFGTAALPWKTALLVEVSFAIEGHTFACHVFSFFPDESMVRVRQGIDAFLEALA